MTRDAATPALTHLDEGGAARMVDVSGKDVTVREAVATGRVRVSREVVRLLRGDGVAKGDALGVARIAGIMGAKRAADLIPLCHPLSLSGVVVDLGVRDDSVEIAATVRTTDRTGVEMEALTAVCVAALALVDMVKSVDKAAVIGDVSVARKSGGRSGTWVRGERADGAGDSDERDPSARDSDGRDPSARDSAERDSSARDSGGAAT